VDTLRFRRRRTSPGHPVTRIHTRQYPGNTLSGDTFRIVVHLIVLMWVLAPVPSEAKDDGVKAAAPRHATPVQIGIKLQQVTQVDQRAQNFGVVATILMQWHATALGYDPETDLCHCKLKVLKDGSFDQLLSEKGERWPEFTIFNQQGNRFAQNRGFVILPDGTTSYFERFSTTLQAPDFNFRRFPFDTQEFFIHVDSLYPEEFYVFKELEQYSEVATRLGQQEWVVESFDTFVSSVTASTRSITSRYSFRITAHRNRNYYIFRILIPITVILLVGWATFFVRDYGRRIDLSTGMLLVFVAFNFTISNDLPRLGYLTFLDTLVFCAFMVTSFVVLMNMHLFRTVMSGREALAHRLDRYLIVGYPSAWIAGILVLLFEFEIL